MSRHLCHRFAVEGSCTSSCRHRHVRLEHFTQDDWKQLRTTMLSKDKHFTALPPPLQHLFNQAISITSGGAALSPKAVNVQTRLCFAHLTYANCNHSPDDPKHGVHRRPEDFSSQDWALVKDKMLTHPHSPFVDLRATLQKLLMAAVNHCAASTPPPPKQHPDKRLPVKDPVKDAPDTAEQACRGKPCVLPHANGSPKAQSIDVQDALGEDRVHAEEVRQLRDQIQTLQAQLEAQRKESESRPHVQEIDSSPRRFPQTCDVALQCQELESRLDLKGEPPQVESLRKQIVRLQAKVNELNQDSTVTELQEELSLCKHKETSLLKELAEAREQISSLEQELHSHRRLQSPQAKEEIVTLHQLITALNGKLEDACGRQGLVVDGCRVTNGALEAEFNARETELQKEVSTKLRELKAQKKKMDSEQSRLDKCIKDNERLKAVQQQECRALMKERAELAAEKAAVVERHDRETFVMPVLQVARNVLQSVIPTPSGGSYYSGGSNGFRHLGVQASQHRHERTVLSNPCRHTGSAFKRCEAGAKRLGFSSLQDALSKDAIEIGYHGTPTADNACTILCRGFDPSKRGTNGQVHGRGEYFDTNAREAIQYARGTGCILVCLILKGDHLKRVQGNTGDPYLVCDNPMPGVRDVEPPSFCFPLYFWNLRGDLPPCVRCSGTPEAVPCAKSVPDATSTSIAVEYLDDHGQWVPADTHFAQQLIPHFKRAGERGFVVIISGVAYPYSVDLGTMQQCNTQTGKKRPIRFRQTTLPQEDEDEDEEEETYTQYDDDDDEDSQHGFHHPLHQSDYDEWY